MLSWLKAVLIDTMNPTDATPRFKRKHGFSGRHQLVDTGALVFIALLIFGLVIGVALWCAFGDDPLPVPKDGPPAASKFPPA